MKLYNTALKNYHIAIVFLLNVFLIYSLYHLVVFDIIKSSRNEVGTLIPEIARHLLFAVSCILLLMVKRIGIYVWLIAICLPECLNVLLIDNPETTPYKWLFILTDYILIPGLLFTILTKDGKSGWKVLFGKEFQYTRKPAEQSEIDRL